MTLKGIGLYAKGTPSEAQSRTQSAGFSTHKSPWVIAFGCWAIEAKAGSVVENPGTSKLSLKFCAVAGAVRVGAMPLLFVRVFEFMFEPYAK